MSFNFGNMFGSGDQQNPQDSQAGQDPQAVQKAQSAMNTLGMLQAAVAISNANRHPGASTMDLLVNGIAGYQQGKVASDQMAMMKQAKTLQMQMQMAKYVKERQEEANRETYILSLPKDQQALARAAGEKYLTQASDFAFAPQKSAIAIQESMGKSGKYFNPQTQRYENMPGYVDAESAQEGAKVYAKGMNTPLAVQQGGSVVMPGMSMTGYGGAPPASSPSSFPQQGGQNIPQGPFSNLMAGAAQKYGLDPLMLHSVAMAESGGNPNAVSPKGAAGVMQLMPGTAKDMGVSDPADPAQNIEGGAKYLSGLRQRYKNDVISLAAYNAGPGFIDGWLAKGGNWNDLPRETRDYVSKVMLTHAAAGVGQKQGANPPGVLFQGVNADAGNQETAHDKKIGEELGTRFFGAQDAANGAQAQLRRFETLNDLLAGFETGKFGELRLDAARFLKGVGAENVAEQISNGNLGGAEAARALQNQVALMFRDPSQGAGMPGSMSDKDREFLQSMVPGLSTSPEGRKLLIEAQRMVAKRAEDAAALWRSQRKRNGGRNTADIYDELAEFQQKDLLNDDFRKRAASILAGNSAQSPQVADTNPSNVQRGTLPDGFAPRRPPAASAGTYNMGM